MMKTFEVYSVESGGLMDTFNDLQAAVTYAQDLEDETGVSMGVAEHAPADRTVGKLYR